MDSEFKTFEEKIKGKAIWNEPMKNHTSYGIGGPVLCLFYPATEKDLQNHKKSTKIYSKYPKIFRIGLRPVRSPHLF